MARADELVAWILERLEPLGPLRSRAMFGGHGIWLDAGPLGGPDGGLFFALVANGTLYVKADDDSRGLFEAEGLEAFQPFADRPGRMNYYPVPDEVLEDQAALVEWANRGVAAALRAPRRRPRRPRGG
ncbi:MAG TPA: TfoX/Sxy family protein [Pseudomonadales bacterium]|nr:TfoX/Sxy family protein [Pseudomonadales bacterium]